MRYFLVVYSGFSPEKGSFRGNISFQFDKFPSFEDIKKTVNLGEIVIENIIELNIFDFYELNNYDLSLKEYASALINFLTKKYKISKDELSDNITNKEIKNMFLNKQSLNEYILL